MNDIALTIIVCIVCGVNKTMIEKKNTDRPSNYKQTTKLAIYSPYIGRPVPALDTL